VCFHPISFATTGPLVSPHPHHHLTGKRQWPRSKPRTVHTTPHYHYHRGGHFQRKKGFEMKGEAVHVESELPPNQKLHKTKSRTIECDPSHRKTTTRTAVPPPVPVAQHRQEQRNAAPQKHGGESSTGNLQIARVAALREVQRDHHPTASSTINDMGSRTERFRTTHPPAASTSKKAGSPVTTRKVRIAHHPTAISKSKDSKLRPGKYPKASLLTPPSPAARKGHNGGNRQRLRSWSGCQQPTSSGPDFTPEGNYAILR